MPHLEAYWIQHQAFEINPIILPTLNVDANDATWGRGFQMDDICSGWDVYCREIIIIDRSNIPNRAFLVKIYYFLSDKYI